MLTFYHIYREKSAVSHSITWRHPLSAKRIDINGATAFAVSGQFHVELNS